MADSSRPTIKDVAKMAGVTSAIVSRVVNADETLAIRHETKQAVLDAIKALGYRPNTLARSLRTRKSGMVGLIIVDWMNPFYGSLIRGAQHTLQQNGLFCLVCESMDDTETELKLVKYLHEMQVEGIILATIKIKDPVVDLLESLGTKYVQATRRSEYSSAPSIYYDSYNGMKEIVRHLVGLGHKKIAYISGSTLDSPGRDRFNGYVDGLSENGIELLPEYVVGKNWFGENARELTKRLVELPTSPTAIITCNDACGLHCLSAVKECGLKVPHDISIASFNNIETTRLVTPALTTIDTPMDTLGEQAARLMINEIQHIEGEAKSIIISTRFVERESTGPCREA
jgi:Transcriptional regulators